MKRTYILLSIVLVVILSGCGIGAYSDTLYQVSTLQSLLLGNYEGAITARELVKHGNTGLGTFDDLDGEMIVLDGTVYKAKYDGTVDKVLNSETVPFANVAHMGAETAYEMAFTGGYDQLKTLLDSLYPDENMPVIFRIDGDFQSIHYRSVPEQDEINPPPLMEVVKHQSEFEQDQATGTLVGFRFPAYLSELNATGYHLHFISEDRLSGGHLLAVASGDMIVRARTLDGFNMILPDSLKDMDLAAVGEEDIHQVESKD